MNSTFRYHVTSYGSNCRSLLLRSPRIFERDVQDVTVVGTSMGASIIWSYIELFGEQRLAKAIFVDQAPLQVSSACKGI